MDLISFSYEWVISNFKSCCNNTFYQCIESPLFQENEWQLTLYPSGYMYLSSDLLHVFVRFKKDKKQRMKFNILIAILQNEKDIVCSKDLDTDELSKSISFENFIEKDFLTNNSSTLLKDDKLRILCTITTKKTCFLDLHLQSRLKEFDDFENLLDSKKYSDIIFIVDGKELYAHKNIVSTRSPVFSAMFEHDMKENRENAAIIQDVKYEVFKEMLRFIYSGKVEGISNIAGQLLAAAEKYSIQGLKILCQETILKNLFCENAVEYLVLADSYNVSELKTDILNFIVLHRKEMIKIPEFKSIVNMQSNLIFELVSALMLT